MRMTMFRASPKANHASSLDCNLCIEPHATKKFCNVIFALSTPNQMKTLGRLVYAPRTQIAHGDEVVINRLKRCQITNIDRERRPGSR
jgi:hypothetical protein